MKKDSDDDTSSFSDSEGETYPPPQESQDKEEKEEGGGWSRGNPAQRGGGGEAAGGLQEGAGDAQAEVRTAGQRGSAAESGFAVLQEIRRHHLPASGGAGHLPEAHGKTKEIVFWETYEKT